MVRKLCRMCKFMGNICVQPKHCSVLNLSKLTKTSNGLSLYKLSPQCTNNVLTCTCINCMCDKLDKRATEKFLKKFY